jgi:hypothetical protein
LSVTWSETAGEICADALMHLGVLAAGESASAEDMQAALRSLNGVLHELQLYGMHWPKLSAEASLAWVSGNTVALPSDYYAYPVMWSAVSGGRVKLQNIPWSDWSDLRDTAPSGSPTGFYVDPAGVCYLYPTPTVNPVLTLQYQKIILDDAIASAVDLPQVWINPLGYGVAYELSMMMGLPDNIKMEVSQKWDRKRSIALSSSEPMRFIDFTVREF